MTELIQQEITAGIPSNRIILGGFSQGGAISIFTGITTPIKLGGVFGLSCYLVLADKIKDYVDAAEDANKKTPFFIAHGTADEVCKYEWGRQTAETLEKELGHEVEFKSYPGLPHSAALEEIDDLETFISRCLKQSDAAAATSS